MNGRTLRYPAEVTEQTNPGPWELVDYEWDPLTGLATITRERVAGTREPDRRRAPRLIERVTHIAPQPACPDHTGWSVDAHVRAFVDRGVAFPTRRLL